jgi:transcription termination/antitermination protein NusG
MVIEPLRSEETPPEWFAVQVRGGREQSCAEQLRVRGYEIFLPCYRERRRWSDRVKHVERPLFAGYVFSRLRPHVMGKIVSTTGVIRIVGDSTRPLPIPADEIAALKRIADTRLAAEPWPFVQAGQRVRFETGPLRDTEGIVLMVKNSHRLVVSIPLLQRSVAVEVERDWIGPPLSRLLECDMPHAAAR